jgi:hypothetical protein
MDEESNNIGPHLDEEAIDQFAIGHVGSEEVLTHLIGCDRCAGRVEQVQILRRALASLPQNPVRVFEHHTTDGLIVGSYREQSGRFVSRIVGPQLDCGAFARTETAAIRWCEASFAAMFPEHQCSGMCRRSG